MSAISHNRIRGRALYLEVRDLINIHGTPLTNNEIRDMLGRRYALNDADALRQLYVRVTRATGQLLEDGHLTRTVGMGKNQHIKYTYTACSG